MAGGSGTRLWPLSDKKTPKQFLNLVDEDRSMIQLTRDRFKNFISDDDIYIVSTEDYEELVYEQLPMIKKENIIIQPLNRNTAPCIAYVSKIIEKKYGDANVIVAPSDHNIKNVKLLIDCINLAIDNLESDNIITIGIVPSRIETAYGYIKLGNKLDDKNIYKVLKFVEKPNYDIAKKYCESGEYLWNSGMFIWKNSFILKCLYKYAFDIFNGVTKIIENIDDLNFKDIFYNEYEKMESISIDYAVMEKVKNILVIPGNFGWDDLGGWLSLENVLSKNCDDNLLRGKCVCYKSNNNIIINNSDNLITTVGIDNSIVVCANNNILIMNKENTSDISLVLKKINEEKYDDYL